MKNWIKVKDDKPVVGEYVLLLLEGQIMLKGRLCNNGWSAYFADGEKLVGTREVTHWMLEPALPGEATEENVTENSGQTKREQIAAMALQGLMAVNNKGQFDSPENCLTEAARLSVIAADALLSQLSKP